MRKDSSDKSQKDPPGGHPLGDDASDYDPSTSEEEEEEGEEGDFDMEKLRQYEKKRVSG